jgi:hypothetical protein
MIPNKYRGQLITDLAFVIVLILILLINYLYTKRKEKKLLK